MIFQIRSYSDGFDVQTSEKSKNKGVERLTIQAIELKVPLKELGKWAKPWKAPGPVHE